MVGTAHCAGMPLASGGERSDHSLINTSLERGACGVSRLQTALAVSLAQWKNRWSGYRTLALAFRTPLKQVICLARKRRRPMPAWYGSHSYSAADAQSHQELTASDGSGE